MTWQGGKLRRVDHTPLPFARLRAWAGPKDDPAACIERLSKALAGLRAPMRLQIRLVSGDDGESTEQWALQGGPKSAKATKAVQKNADVVVVMSPDTWLQIAQGQLAPYEALYAGRMRVGGDFEMAKALVKHLTDPAAAYVAPC